MFTQDEANALVGATAYDEGGQKVGQVTAVYQDKITGAPEWLTVRTGGLFGRNEAFVPLELARPRIEDGVDLSRVHTGVGDVVLATRKDQVTTAPKIGADGQLSPAEEEQLYAHYGLSYSPVTPTGPLPVADEAMLRSEERMHVGTETEEASRVRLRKYTVTEQVTQTVPVTHEEVRVEREPVTAANVGEVSGPDFAADEREVTLYAEHPVVTKETVPVERVRLAKDTVAGEVTVSGEVRREQIDTDGGDS